MSYGILDGVDDCGQLTTPNSMHSNLPEFRVKAVIRLKSAVNSALWGRSADFNNYISILTSNDTIRIRYGGSTVSIAAVFPRDGEFHELIITREVGGKHTVFIDGVEIGSVTNNINSTNTCDMLFGASSGRAHLDVKLLELWNAAVGGSLLFGLDANTNNKAAGTPVWADNGSLANNVTMLNTATDGSFWFDSSGGGGTTYNFTLAPAEQLNQASSLTTSTTQAFVLQQAEQLNQASPLQLATTASFTLIAAQQLNQANTLTLATKHAFALIAAEQINNSVTLTAGVTSGFNLAAAEQLNQVTNLTLSSNQVYSFNLVTAQQLSHVSNISSQTTYNFLLAAVQQQNQIPELTTSSFYNFTITAAEQVNNAQVLTIFTQAQAVKISSAKLVESQITGQLIKTSYTANLISNNQITARLQ